MDEFHDERTARATLGWLCEPGNPFVQQFLPTRGATEMVDMLFSG
ncbi:hypothetical protein ACTMTJ_34735 [Phytohabitans sp. LJ34]